MVGAVPAGKAVLRSGARPGDWLYVTGSLGGAAAGLSRLEALRKKPATDVDRADANLPDANGPETYKHPALASGPLKAILAPHLYPEPRIAQGRLLLDRRLATAALDISDGLSTDLAHLCAESDVAAVVDADRLPVAPAATQAQALHGGEDYELLFTAAPGTPIPRRIAGVPVARIGSIMKAMPGQPRVSLMTDGVVEALEARGWEHFS
jgi:thiamine-monophosphate kinase